MINVGGDETLTVRDKEGKVCPLKYLQVSEAKEMLGIYLAPDGNDRTQFLHLKKKIKKWIDFLSTGGLDWGTVWTALQTTIMKSISYALPATSFTETQIKKLLTPFVKVQVVLVILILFIKIGLEYISCHRCGCKTTLYMVLRYYSLN